MTTMTVETHGKGHDHHGDHDEPHVLPISFYLAVWGALVVLTAITVFVAHFDFGSMNTVIAMLVATIKASLVAMFFMHLRWDNKLNLVILLGSMMLVAIFFYPTLTDLTSRGLMDSLRNQIINYPGSPPPPIGGH
jgi:cytochrome c oxidase subunit IV